MPNLIGNCPDWDRIRAIADAHGLQVIEDSCDALGAKLRGTPTGTRSDISVTSFALAHVITAAATGGMVLLDDDELDRPLRAAAPLGPSIGDAVLRLEEGRQALLHRGRRHRVRQPLHLRRGGLELRALRDQRRVRRGAAAQAAAQPRPSSAQLRPAVGVLRHLPRGVRAAAPDRRARDRVAHVPGAHPARVGDPAGRIPGAHGGSRRGHAHGVDRQRHPAAGVREGAAPRARRAGCPTPTGSWSRG